MPPKDKQPDNTGLSAALKTILAENRKTVFTALPGIITAYDGTSKRASVQPTPRTAFKDGTMGALPILPNVPVLSAAGGGYCVAVNLIPGDAVLLVFCQRGIKAFKKTFGLEDSSGGVLDINSPVALAGFGGLSIAGTEGISLQKEDGTVKVEIRSDNVLVEAPAKVNIVVGSSGGAEYLPDGTVNFANGIVFTASGAITTPSTIDAGGAITAAGDVSSDTITINTHVHPITGGSSAPGPTGVGV